MYFKKSILWFGMVAERGVLFVATPIRVHISAIFSFQVPSPLFFLASGPQGKVAETLVFLLLR